MEGKFTPTREDTLSRFKCHVTGPQNQRILERFLEWVSLSDNLAFSRVFKIAFFFNNLPDSLHAFPDLAE